MSSIKVPVLLTRYSEQLFTARVVDGPAADAAARTATEAMTQVQKFLKQQAEREPYQYWPKIDNYELHNTAVRVRLFYRDGNRQFPASREMKIPVRYVLGRYVDDSVECFLSDYDIIFHCPALRELPQLIDEAVRYAAARIASRQLIAATPPANASELRIVRLRLKERRLRIDHEATGALAIVADPLVKTARKRKSTPTRHRDGEVAQLLGAMKDASVLLVGEAGSGKTTVTKLAAANHQSAVRELAKSLGNPPPPPLVWESSAENLIAGMQYLGEWEQRLEEVIAELESIGGVLFLSSQIDLVRLGGTQPTDSLAAFLMPYVRRGEIRLISESTPEELDAARRLLPGWVECFQIINVQTLTHGQTRDIAETMLKDASRNHRIDVEDTAAETATRLFAQFMPYLSPPKGVVQMIGDVIEETRRQVTFSTAGAASGAESSTETSKLRLSKSAARQPSASRRPKISTRTIVDHFTRLTGLPETMLRDSLTLHSDQVRQRLQQDVIGQAAAVQAATNVVLKLKAGLCDPRRPVATMLFCGPTGVGKTQLAQSLADYLFGHAVAADKPHRKSADTVLVRLDMSEYASWDAVDRFLIGADGEVAPWIARLRDRPMSVVLLDEFEKASPEVHDCLLSALDEGRLTDRFGRTTTLCGSIVVLTSNVGSRSTELVGFSSEANRALERAIEQEFRPEFLNRLDEVVIFEPLPAAVIEQIVEKELRALSRRETLRSRRVQLEWDDAVVKRLAAVGFDPLLGARPLQRAIEREVVAKIARKLLESDEDSEPILINLSKLVSDESLTKG